MRNYQARNFIRSMNSGDLFFFYHSSCPQPGIAGIARIEGEAYPDPTALDPASPYHDPKASAGKNPGAPATSASSKPSPRSFHWPG